MSKLKVTICELSVSILHILGVEVYLIELIESGKFLISSCSEQLAVVRVSLLKLLTVLILHFQGLWGV